MPPSSLINYLDYYRHLDKPGYAVLITGRWGVGKTFQVLNAFEKSDIFYVSLFGLSTSDEIYAQVYAAMHPYKAKAKRVARGVGETGVDFGAGSISLGGAVSGLVNALMREQVNTSRILVFDDLERCSLDVAGQLGIINRYVEHHGCRVLVIAHDEKLSKEFIESREKVFGQVIKVEPQYDLALNSFEKAYEGKRSYPVLQACASEILEVFNASDVGSLRMLKHLIDDLVRLYELLSDAYTSNTEAMVDLTRLFTALHLEVKSGNLNEEDLKKRSDKVLVYHMRQDSTAQDGAALALATADLKYAMVDLTDQLLNDKCCVDMLLNGSFVKSEINSSVGNSPYFMEPVSMEPWRIFIEFDSMEPSAVDTSIVDLKSQFDQRLITEYGEIRHLFSLRFLFSQMGLIDATYEQVVEECRSYVNDLVSSNRLAPRPSGYRWSEIGERSYGGYGYWVEDEYKVMFQEVSKFIMDGSISVFRSSFPDIAKELVRLVVDDASEFSELISHTNTGKNKYASVSVLTATDPSIFVDAWLRSAPRNWYTIRSALIRRYSTDLLNRELQDEAPWLINVLNLLEAECESAPGVLKKRIDRTIPRELRDLANQALSVPG